jgi:hypothetical protein
MADTTLRNELNEALQVDILNNPANENLPPSACAEQFYNSHPQLMEKLKRPWLVQRLTKMIKNGTHQGWPKLEFDSQMNLPGFEDLPRRIFLRDGRRKLLDKATVGDIRQHIKMLRDRFLQRPKIKRMEAVLELMEKYSKIKPKITWREVKQRESNFPAV